MRWSSASPNDARNRAGSCKPRRPGGSANWPTPLGQWHIGAGALPLRARLRSIRPVISGDPPRAWTTPRTGTRTRSSTSCTSARSATATATASATSAGLIAKLDYLAGPRRHGDLAAAVLSLAAARRRLRHRRLPRVNPAYGTLRDFAPLPPRGPRPRPARHHRAGAQPHLRPAPLVPARPPRAARQPLARTSTSGATRPTATATRASSSRTSSPRTGPGTRSPSRTTGTASTRTSRT